MDPRGYEQKNDSVTRWVNCMFNIWQFTTIKIYQMAKNICKSWFIFLSNTKITNTKKLAKTLKKSERGIFSKSGHTGCQLRFTVGCMPTGYP